MKTKNFTMPLLAFILAVMLCMTNCVTALAADDFHVGPHANQSEAQVSDEKDTTTNKDNGISTNFFMYIESDKITHSTVPDMGDEGMDPVHLLLITFCVGICYLGCSAYAKDKEERT